MVAFQWEGTTAGVLLGRREQWEAGKEAEKPWFHMKPEGLEETKLFRGLRHVKELVLILKSTIND